MGKETRYHGANDDRRDKKGQSAHIIAEQINEVNLLGLLNAASLGRLLHIAVGTTASASGSKGPVLAAVDRRLENRFSVFFLLHFFICILILCILLRVCFHAYVFLFAIGR